MHLYKTSKGNLVKKDNEFFVLEGDWDQLINQPGLHAYLKTKIATAKKLSGQESGSWLADGLQAPIGTQEVWAAGVTYLRSRDARMEESEVSGGADFYSKVYVAERPEIFFKSLAHRVSGHGQEVNIRRDSTWNVPEPELTLFINSKGTIEAYTIGNDMSSRSIEGENPLYLPQAKTYERSAGLGPCLYVPAEPLSPETVIRLEIFRDEQLVFEDSTPISRMKRTLPELAGFLYREMDFPVGSFLMTGTCLVPPNDFTLAIDDEVKISIDNIGTLTNVIAEKSGR